MKEDQQMFTVKEVADMFNVSVQSVYKWIKTNAIKAEEKKKGRFVNYSFTNSQIQEFKEKFGI